jgi:hypothetical protein
MPLKGLQRLSYVIPALVVAFFNWAASPSWWALAMLVGGLMFLWDWLWGDRQLLDAKHGLLLMGLGVLSWVAGIWLADGLGISIAEFIQLAKGLHRRSGWLYRLPAIGVGLFIYGLIIWSRAWQIARDKRW